MPDLVSRHKTFNSRFELSFYDLFADFFTNDLEKNEISVRDVF